MILIHKFIGSASVRLALWWLKHFVFQHWLEFPVCILGKCYLSFDLWLLSFRSMILLIIPKPPNAARHFEEKAAPAAIKPAPANKLHNAVDFFPFCICHSYAPFSESSRLLKIKAVFCASPIREYCELPMYRQAKEAANSHPCLPYWLISFLAVNWHYFVLNFLHIDLLHLKISATRLSTMNSKTAK